MAKKNTTTTAATTNTASVSVNVPFKALKTPAPEAVRAAFAAAIAAFRLDMVIALEEEKRARIVKRLASDSAANLSELKKAALEEEAAALAKSIKDNKAALAKIDAVRGVVVRDIMDQGAEKTVVENFFRVLACFGDKSLNKYALKGVYTSWTPELEAAMNTAHALKFNDKGAPVLGKKEKAAYEAAKNIIKGAVREAVRIPENKYCKAVSVNLNNTDIGALHESYVTGVDLDYDKDKKTGAVSLKSSEYVVKTRVRKPRGKNAEIDASGFWAVAVNCIILHICE